MSSTYDLRVARTRAYEKFAVKSNEILVDALLANSGDFIVADSVTDLPVGYIVAEVTDKYWLRSIARQTAEAGTAMTADLLASLLRRSNIYVVRKATAKSITVSCLYGTVTGLTVQNVESAAAGEDRWPHVRRDTKGSSWIAVAPMADVLATAQADKRYPASVRLFAAHEKAEQASLLADQKEDEARERKGRAADRKVEALNTALGANVFRSSGWDDHISTRVQSDVILALMEAQYALGNLTAGQRRTVKSLVGAE